jgi:hypothetical protein
LDAEKMKRGKVSTAALEDDGIGLFLPPDEDGVFGLYISIQPSPLQKIIDPDRESRRARFGCSLLAPVRDGGQSTGRRRRRKVGGQQASSCPLVTRDLPPFQRAP